MAPPVPTPTETPPVDLETAAGPLAASLDRLQGMSDRLVAAVPALVVAVVVLVAFWILGFVLRASARRVARSYADRHNLALVLGRVAMGVCFTLGVLVAAVLVFPNFTPTSLLQFLGIGSVAIGFAFRDILQNYLAGVLLLITEPFRIGDQIVYKEFEGTVEQIQSRATFVRTYDSRRVVIPNAELFTNPVVVNTAFPSRRLEYDVGVGYGDDLAAAREAILAAMQGAENVLADPPPEVLAYELGESAVMMRARWWVSPPRKNDALDARDGVIRAIRRELDARGIDIPFPTRQVLFHDQTEETDGDRRRQREGWPAGPDRVPRPRALATREDDAPAAD